MWEVSTPSLYISKDFITYSSNDKRFKDTS